MLQTATEQTARLEPPPALPTESSNPLRDELDALNDALRVLHSSNLALRAYAQTWVAFVTLSIAGKLTWDWMQTESKPPVFAIPLALLGLYAASDAVVHRLRQRKLARAEEAQLARQRELRRQLGIDDLVLP